MALAQTADLITFMWAFAVLGIQGEANPLVHRIYERMGIEGVALFKIIGGIVVILALWVIGRISVTILYKVIVAVIISLGVIGAVFNLVAIMRI